MSLDTGKDKFLYQVVVPVLGAVLGAVVATWFQSTNIDKAQLQDVIQLLKDPSLSAAQKLQALQIYREISDRPWALVRSLMTTLMMTISIAVGAMVAGGFFMRKHD